MSFNKIRSLRGRRLEVVGASEERGARGTHASLIYTKFTQCKYGTNMWKLRLNQVQR